MWVLNLTGYRVKQAGSGPEALASLERAPYDLMILDMHMPEMDGIEVMHRARQLRPDLSIRTRSAAVAGKQGDKVTGCKMRNTHAARIALKGQTCALEPGRVKFNEVFTFGVRRD